MAKGPTTKNILHLLAVVLLTDRLHYIQASTGFVQTDPRIVGGETAKQEDFHYQVAVLIRDGFACGGTIVSEKCILTAGHCCGYDYTDYKVVAGTHNLRDCSKDAPCVSQTLTLSNVSRHSGYSDATLQNDICALQLSTPLKLDPEFRTKAIDIAPANFTTDKKNCTVSGWGAVQEDGLVTAWLKYVEMPIVSNADCQTSYKGETIFESMVCAGVPQGGMDSCQGDSGGPLIMKDENGNDCLVGVVSWGYGCARPGLPGVYTRCSSYHDWILAQILGFSIS